MADTNGLPNVNENGAATANVARQTGVDEPGPQDFVLAVDVFTGPNADLKFDDGGKLILLNVHYRNFALFLVDRTTDKMQYGRFIRFDADGKPHVSHRMQTRKVNARPATLHVVGLVQRLEALRHTYGKMVSDLYADEHRDTWPIETELLQYAGLLSHGPRL